MHHAAATDEAMIKVIERLDRIEAAIQTLANDRHLLNGNNAHAIVQRLDRIEAVLATPVKLGHTQEWYDTQAVAKELGKSPYTVRKHCRDKRIHAEKRQCGRGRSKEWRISHAELLRIKEEGLLPAPRTNRRTADRGTGSETPTRDGGHR